jgi:hypothetical protein
MKEKVIIIYEQNINDKIYHQIVSGVSNGGSIDIADEFEERHGPAKR